MPKDPSEACEEGRYQRERKWWGCSPGDKHTAYQEIFYSSESYLAAEPSPRGSPLGGSPNYCMGLHNLHGNTLRITILLVMLALMALNNPNQTSTQCRKGPVWMQGLQRTIARADRKGLCSNTTLLLSCFVRLVNVLPLGHLAQTDQATGRSSHKAWSQTDQVTSPPEKQVKEV